MKIHSSLRNSGTRIAGPTARRAKVKRKGHPPTKLTDQQVLEARALREFARWKPARIAERYGVPVGCIMGILYYKSRAILEPTRANLPTDI